MSRFVLVPSASDGTAARSEFEQAAINADNNVIATIASACAVNFIASKLVDCERRAAAGLDGSSGSVGRWLLSNREAAPHDDVEPISNNFSRPGVTCQSLSFEIDIAQSRVLVTHRTSGQDAHEHRNTQSAPEGEPSRAPAMNRGRQAGFSNAVCSHPFPFTLLKDHEEDRTHRGGGPGCR